MRRILLTPYPGEVIVTRDRKEHARLYRRMFHNACPENYRDGLTTYVPGQPEFLVYARNTPALVHELSHVVLDLFHHVRTDPIEGNGEPFAYLITHLFREASKK